MPRDYPRTLRLGEQIRRELAMLIDRELKDPRIGMVTINDVEVSADLAHAKVYYTVLGDAVAREQTREGLEKASGFLRGRLGKILHTRVTPELHFIYDETEERGRRLDDLIARARAEDAARHGGEGEA